VGWRDRRKPGETPIAWASTASARLAACHLRRHPMSRTVVKPRSSIWPSSRAVRCALQVTGDAQVTFAVLAGPELKKQAVGEYRRRHTHPRSRWPNFA